MSNSNQFQLLSQKRYLPFFITQFLGAFNDNLYKNALIVMFSFSAISIMGLDSDVLINFAAVIFILPFFLFSATAGQLADKFDNSTLMQYVKLMEVIIMICAAIGFYFESHEILLFVLFLMGTQSAFFGPVKYGYLPRVLNKEELIGGNGMTDMGTFLAILIGMIVGAHTIMIQNGTIIVSTMVVFFAFMGYLSARKIPPTGAASPDLKFNLNPASETLKIIKYCHSNRTVFLSVIGISWFWFYGSIIITQIPNFTRNYIYGDEGVFVLLMGIFSVSVGIGSLLCEKLSGGRIEIGLVPLGSLGLTVFAVDFYLTASYSLNPIAGQLYNVAEFMNYYAHWRIMFDVFMIGISSGFYIVPLYALIQSLTEQGHISRVIAANNIINSLFMVTAGLAAMLFLSLGNTIPGLILVTGIMNFIVAVYIYKMVNEFLWRFIVWISLHTIYRVKTTNLHHVPKKGAAVLVCNHISFVDALIIAGYIQRPVRFVMDHHIFSNFILGPVFRLAKAIPIASAKEDPTVLESAYQQIKSALDDGEVVCIFPEGAITRDGNMGPFKSGIEKIIKASPVPVIPMAIQGLWGSYFSRKKGKAMSGLPSFPVPKVNLLATKAIAPEHVSAQGLYDAVFELRGDKL